MVDVTYMKSREEEGILVSFFLQCTRSFLHVVFLCVSHALKSSLLQDSQ